MTIEADGLGLGQEREHIEAFVDRISDSGAVDEEWTVYVAARRDAEFNDLIADENLRPDPTREFIDRDFRDCAGQASGATITAVLPPRCRGSRRTASTRRWRRECWRGRSSSSSGTSA